MAGGNVPAALRPVFQAAGRQYHIPPSVLAGVASVETNLGQNRSTSSAGAIGLMQFMPGTARSIGINPLNDRQAIYGAAKLLNQYGYQSNALRALGAYNGGPGNPQYSYANQVMSEAKRLGGQLAGQASSSLPGGPAATSATGAQFRSVTTPTFDQAGYQQAQRSAIAGNYLKSTPDPYAGLGAKTGLSNANPLVGVLGTTPPNPADYTSAQTHLQRIAGTGTPLNQHPVAAAAAISSAGYTNPLPGATWERTDMGVDASMPNGSAIHAIGDSKVIGISPNWYKGQPYVLFQLTSGPQRGRYYYIAEAINVRVRPGQRVRAGQTVGTFNSGGTGLELGWGSPTPGRTLAAATTGYSEGQVTPAGASFRNFLHGLGAKT